MGLGRRFFLSTIKKDVGLPFISEWRTTNTSVGSTASDQVKLPLVNGGTYNFVVNWGDGNSDTITAWNQAETTHTYAISGDYTITITGICIRWSFNNGQDRLKILTVSQWGIVDFTGSNSCFFGCANLNVTATDIPKLGTSLSQFFRACTSLTGNSSFNNWDVSNVTAFNSMFQSAPNFNQNIGNWDVSNGTNFSSMFNEATAFNNGGSSDINNWNVSIATNFNGMFRLATNFNQDISSWNVALVTNFSQMFNSAVNFNQNIGSWNVGSGTLFNLMFQSATSFNQNIGSWNVSSGTNFSSMFALATGFNQNIGSWNVSSGTNFASTFNGATNFNQNISSWNVSNSTTFNGMFQNATAFNQNIGGWNVGNCTNFSLMFSSATAFNQDIGSWNVAKASNLTNFMAGKTAANYSAANLDSIYNGWSALTFVNTGLTISFGTIKYTASGQAGRDILTDPPNNWTITDGGI